jgi:nucleoside-diphosphate-sugar epimerase
MSPGGPILVTGAAVRVGDVGGAVVEALRWRDLSVRALVRRDDERGDALGATGAEVVVAPRPALTGTLLDPFRGRQRIEASPGKEQVSGSEMG